MKRWKIGLVVARYGEEILGGAETLARGLAEQAAREDLIDVEILTTCARDHLTWRNEFTPGVTLLNGVKVTRFPVAHHQRNTKRYDELHLRLMHGGALSIDEQYEWVEQSAHSPALYATIERFGATFDFLIFIPYLFATTYYGAMIFPQRAILWPCLHDEVYARLDPTRLLFASCRGVMFNAQPEARLAEWLYGSHRGAQIVGFGLPALQGDGNRFRQLTDIHSPYILYSGRFESAKNLPLLIQYFVEYKRNCKNSLKLVLMGTGPEKIIEHPDIIIVGFKQGQVKMDAYAGALVLCQPSINESFSIVIMESWLCGVPVLVHSDCVVTRYHLAQSNGGLHFRDYADFEAVVDLLLTDESLRQKLGANGKHYVRTKYDWQPVMQRFVRALEFWDAL